MQPTGRRPRLNSRDPYRCDAMESQSTDAGHSRPRLRRVTANNTSYDKHAGTEVEPSDIESDLDHSRRQLKSVVCVPRREVANFDDEHGKRSYSSSMKNHQRERTRTGKQKQRKRENSNVSSSSNGNSSDTSVHVSRHEERLGTSPPYTSARSKTKKSTHKDSHDDSSSVSIDDGGDRNRNGHSSRRERQLKHNANMIDEEGNDCLLYTSPSPRD